MRLRTAFSALLGFAAAAVFFAATAAPSVKAVQKGRIATRQTASGPEEILTVERGLAPALLRVPVEGRVQLADWPIAPGVRRAVTLTRHDVYAPGARIVKIVPEGEVEVPRSRWVFFWGSDAEGQGVVLSVDPDAGVLRGLSMSELGVFELSASAGGSRQYRVGISAAEATGAASAANFVCGQDSLPPVPPDTARTPPTTLVRPESTETYTKYAVIAIDTDNEYLLYRFADDTIAATNYIASIFATVNVQYERDVNIHLLEGYTILRPSSVPDPYPSTVGGNADGTKLNEFGNYWNAHYGSIKRTLAAMLSGKQGAGGGSASGIAWIGGLCSGFVGYSFNQLFTSSYPYGDNLIFGHEVGHNFGSPHTHCYSPPADQCYSGECYTGPTSCPAPQTMQGVPNVTGTVMSYCHLIGCWSPVFHPRTMSEYFNNAINGASACIFNVGGGLPPGPTVTSISPPSGSLAGGTPVTISGSNFSAGATVAFADLSGSVSVSVGTITSGSITATAPAHAAGQVDVVVMNADYQTGSLHNGFTYSVAAPPPSLTSVTPAFGPVAGGTLVTVAGSNFVSGAIVWFGGSSVPGTFVNATTLQATAPAAGAPATVSVGVTNPDAQSGSLPLAYTYSSSGIGFYTVTPCRLVDTRNPTGPYGAPSLATGATRTFVLTGAGTPCGIPAGAKALSVNVVAVLPTAGPGFLTLYPGGAPRPASATLNYNAGKIRANNTVVSLGAAGDITIFCSQGTGTLDLVLDVNGYFQ